MHICRLGLPLWAFLLFGCAQTPNESVADRFLGLWQYPERRVWIQINSDGSAFQCRIAQGGMVIASRGTLVQGSTIVWEELWDPDQLSTDSRTLTIDGTFGTFDFERAAVPMDEACLSGVK